MTSDAMMRVMGNDGAVMGGDSPMSLLSAQGCVSEVSLVIGGHEVSDKQVPSALTGQTGKELHQAFAKLLTTIQSCTEKTRSLASGLNILSKK